MKRMIFAFLAYAVATYVGAASALSQEPVGCDKFKWSLDNERAMLASANLPIVSSGSTLARPLPVGLVITLAPFADAKLPLPPERAPKSPTSFAGFLQVSAPPRGGTLKITLSSEAWIDVVQGGLMVKSGDFSGATGCEGVRKSVKFDLAVEPFVIQVSDVQVGSIAIAITSE